MRSSTSFRWSVCAVVGIALCVGSAGQAAAQGDGVHVDPNSPAGTEYALPLESARGDTAESAGPDGRAADGASEAAPLFGAGISRRGTTDGSENSGTRTSSDDDDGSRVGGGGGAVASKSIASAVAESGSGISGGLLTALIGLGVLGLGAIVGLSLRALRTTEHSR